MMMTAPAFPLLATVRDAYRDVFGDLKSFFKVTWLIWLMLMLCVEVPVWMVTEKVRADLEAGGGLASLQDGLQKMPEAAPVPAPAPEGTAPEDAPRHPLKPEYMAALMAVNLVQLVLLMCFVVAWYRGLLLHERKGETVRLRLGKNELYYAWVNMKVSLAMLPVVMIVGILMGFFPGDEKTMLAVFGIPGLLLALYVQARLVLGYPLAAVGENEAPIRQSWGLTKGQGASILAGNGLIFIPLMGGVMLVTYLLSLLIGGAAPPVDDGSTVVAKAMPLPMLLLLKAFGAYFTLFLLATLSAFHARVYATLVRKAA